VTLALNERAQRLADHLASNASNYRVAVHLLASGLRVIDCGIQISGGLQAGLSLAKICMAGLAEVSLVPGEVGGTACPLVQVVSDHPVTACMASQYAGWEIKVGKFFAMGSGPMRAIYGKEKIFEEITGPEQATSAVGALESRKLPTDEVASYLSEKLNLPANKITLLVAPALSVAGGLQVVARSLETALHKLYELKFDLKQIECGFGSAPLPPPAKDELLAIGRTNDAILYGGRVVLWARAEDDQIAEIGPRVPSSSSPDHGAPFAEIFARYGQDFYKIDPLLFSPAEVVFCNLQSGRMFSFGRTEPQILEQSFKKPA
jgi:methenyltetrahydromethanopterin cyclohydrolase